MTFDSTSVEVTCVTLPKDHCVQVPWKYIKVCGDPFCKNLNQRSLTPRWPLTPHLLRSHVWLYPRIIVSKSHENTSKYVDTVNLFAKTWTKGHWPLDDLWLHICWGHMCDSTQGSLCPSPMKIHQSMWRPFLQKLEPKVIDPRWPLTPHLLRSHVWLYPRIIVSKSHENTSKYVDTVTFFAKKNLNQRSLTPRWPLTPHLLRSHVWLYSRIIVSKSHENTSKYVDTVNLFAKTWTKGHWPLDDLWPHVSWGHMCDSTQGSLCPSPMTVHQCMWIQWSILQNTTYIHTHTYYVYYVHTTYILHTTYRMSDHIVSYWTQFRRDKKWRDDVEVVQYPFKYHYLYRPKDKTYMFSPTVLLWTSSYSTITFCFEL